MYPSVCVCISPSRCLLGSAFRFRDCSIQEWYGDLTTESSFEDFQNFFFKERTLAGVCEAPACPGCRTAVRGEKCYEDVKWALHTGIPQHPDAQAWKGVCPFHCVSSNALSKNMSNEICIIHFLKACCLLSRTTPHDLGGNEEWYNGLTTSSSFEEVQEFLWQEDINDNCARPCEPLCSSNGNCSAMGVNVFGFDGFSDEASVKRAVRSLFKKGMRNFRVVNVGGSANAVLTAINEAAGMYPEPSSVKITSLFFDSASALSQKLHLHAAVLFCFKVPFDRPASVTLDAPGLPLTSCPRLK